MTQAFNLSQFANKLNSSGQTDNTGLQNSSLTVTAGTGLSGGGAVALGASTTVNLANTAVTAGTYTAPTITVDAQGRLTSAANGVASTYIGARGQLFTASGTFTIPASVTAIKATIIGGGGGNGYPTGNNGGTSSISSGSQSISTVSATGGTGQNWNTTAVFVSSGSGSGGSINVDGGLGSCAVTGCDFGASQTTNISMGGDGAFGFGQGRRGVADVNAHYTALWGPAGFGYGYNAYTNSLDYASQTSSGGGGSIAFLTGLTPSATITVTVGAGGSASVGGGNVYGGAGGGGCVLIEW